MKKKYISKEEFNNWEKLVFREFKNDSRKYIQDKFVLFIFSPDFQKKIKMNMFHIGKKEIDSVSYGLEDDMETLRLPATDTGGLTNVSYNIKTGVWSHRQILFFDNNSSIDDIYSIWESLSNKKFNLSTKRYLKKWIESIPPNFKLGIARTKIENSVIIIPAEEIKKKIGQYMFRNYGGDNDTYAYLTNNIKNLYCKLRKDKTTPNINKSNMDVEYTLI